MKSWVKRILVVAVSIEVAYLILANLALNLPLTQDLINRHRPEQYAVTWERAWSWYPLKVHGRGVSANGQTPSQQWQVEVPAASVRVAALPLLTRTVRLHDAEASSVDFRLRPRPKPDRDYARIRDGFPTIDNRDPNLMAGPRKQWKEGRGWRVEANGLRVHGSHRVWIFNVRGEIDGNAEASVRYESRGGPFSLDQGAADLRLGALYVGGDRPLAHEGAVEGVFELAPFVPSENRGWRSLAFLSLDARLDLPVETLDFLDPYLRRFNGMEVEGKGRVSGRIHYQKGDLVAGTDVDIPAEDLLLSASGHEVRGAGSVEMRVTASEPDTLAIGFRFDALDAFHAADGAHLFSGDGLTVLAEGTSRLLPDAERTAGAGRVGVVVPGVSVPDLSAYQRYLPARWGVGLVGGSGELTGEAHFSADSLSVDLDLSSESADLALKDYRFRSDLELGLRADGLADTGTELDLSGSFLRFEDASLSGAGADADSDGTWDAAISVREGLLQLPLPEPSDEGEQPGGFGRALAQRNLESLLTDADARLDLVAGVSSLGWLNALFDSPYGLAVGGHGEARVRIGIEDGWVARGSELKVRPQDLRVDVLDYRTGGEGDVRLLVEEGGERLGLLLEVALNGGSLKRRDEEQAVVDDLVLTLEARAEGVNLTGGGETTELNLRIPSARLGNVSVYNDYLPRGAPLELLDGEAALSADVRLQRDSAGGFVKLAADRLRARVDEQELEADLKLDVTIAGGAPAAMDFDISGSSLLLQNVRVAGAEQDFDDDGWEARFDFTQARAVWRKPIRLDADAEVRLEDSRPIVAMFANHRGKNGWLERLLTVQDIEGRAQVSVADDRIVVSHALAGSDRIDVGVKGVIVEDGGEGLVYARFEKLHGLMRMQDGKRRFEILDARDKFEAYRPGEMTPDGMAPR